jgi:hypothetical protein
MHVLSEDALLSEQSGLQLGGFAPAPSTGSGWLVAYPSPTQIGGYFWMGGDPPAAQESALSMDRKPLDECFGD